MQNIMRQKEYLFYVYIVTNYERTTFYVGFTNDIIRRIIEHKYGFGSEFTRKYRLKYLVYYEEYRYVYDAISREKEIKKWRREKKINLIKAMNKELKDLSRELFKDYGISNDEIKEVVQELKDKYKN
jgi:putative endonuclease